MGRSKKNNRKHKYTKTQHKKQFKHHWKRGTSKEKKDPNAIYIYFVHVPKTAGSAIKQTLARNDAHRSIKSEGWTLHTKTGIKVRIIAQGHSGTTHFKHSGPNVFKMATIREPVQRFISAFNFVREGGKNHPNQGAVQQARNWAPYLQKFKTIDVFLADEDAVQYIMDPKTGHTHFDHLMKWINNKHGQTDIDLFIRQTHVNEDFQTLCDIFDLDIQEGSVEPFNVTLGKSKITKTTEKQISALLQEDIVLYNTCLKNIPALIKKTKQRFQTFMNRVLTRKQHASISQPTHAKQTQHKKKNVLYITPSEGVSNHFWHFMMGEFLPIMYVILKHNFKVVYLKKTKKDLEFPLHSFYDEVCKDAHVELHITDEDHPNQHYITPLNWDWKNQKEETKLLWITRYLKKWATTSTCNQKINTCVVQDRNNAKSLDEFYKHYTTRLVKRKTYGTKRRHITNLEDVANRIQSDNALALSVTYVHEDPKTLKEQIQHYLCANHLVLGHGAGMVHMLWMQPNSRVIEIMPQKKFDVHDGAVQGAKRLCNLLNFELKRIVVDKEHCDVDVSKVLQLLKS